MTSDKAASNRNNAQRSSGARTAAGKRRSSRNARKHGLSAPIVTDQLWGDRIETLTRQIAGDDSGFWRREQARVIAEAECDLIRVRDTRARILALSRIDRLFVPQQRQRRAARGKLEPPIREAGSNIIPTPEALASALEQLVLLERYERRALSRRNSAIRRLAERSGSFVATAGVRHLQYSYKLRKLSVFGKTKPKC